MARKGSDGAPLGGCPGQEERYFAERLVRRTKVQFNAQKGVQSMPCHHGSITPEVGLPIQPNQLIWEGAEQHRRRTQSRAPDARRKGPEQEVRLRPDADISGRRWLYM